MENPTGFQKNPFGIILHVEQKVLPVGSWFRQVVFQKEIKITFRILKSCCSFVLIPIGRSFIPAGNSKYLNGKLLLLWVKLISCMNSFFKGRHPTGEIHW